MVETPSKTHQLLLFHSLIFILTLSPSTQQQEQETRHCSKINTTNLSLSPVLNQSILPENLITCRSGRLYLKTSVGLFHVSSIDYTTKTLTLSHSSGRERVKKPRTRVSLEVEGHLPDLCIACERPDGNCGVALRCLCHPKECKNKVVNYATKSRALLSGNSNTQLVLVFSIALFLIS